MQTTPAYRPALHWLAVVTAAVALVPIVFGAVVTSLAAGMAFADWPSSDGHGMFTYPWLESHGDKFVEHGHRLAGALIGLLSIGLAIAARVFETRPWVRRIAYAILLCVIAQGLLGGLRVLANDPRMAMVHGAFAAIVFTLMASFALFTSRTWLSTTDRPALEHVRSRLPLAAVLPIVIFAQYLLGGALRHLHTALFEHVAVAALVVLFVIATCVSALRSGESWLRRPAGWLLFLVLVQASLGGMAYVTRFGWPDSGYVAVQDSMPQVVSRSAHTVVGMLLFMTSVNYLFRVLRLGGVAKSAVQPFGLPAGGVTAKGGAA